MTDISQVASPEDWAIIAEVQLAHYQERLSQTKCQAAGLAAALRALPAGTRKARLVTAALRETAVAVQALARAQETWHHESIQATEQVEETRAALGPQVLSREDGPPGAPRSKSGERGCFSGRGKPSLKLLRGRKEGRSRGEAAGARNGGARGVEGTRGRELWLLCKSAPLMIPARSRVDATSIVGVGESHGIACCLG
jgi:hypothetical protein